MQNAIFLNFIVQIKGYPEPKYSTKNMRNTATIGV